ncbi:MAG: NACHT domain-containing protein [Actinomycetota bacterium]|nr:NACHT domain-containing protein [Actinomycetota bacterium]
MAAYLAAYGLAGVPLPIAEDDSPGSPYGLWLEWTGEVDDLQCRFTEGARWELQAKRRCSWGETFSDVTAQWVAAIRSGEYSEADRVGLAAGHLSGPLRDLRDALRRLRRDPQAELLPREAAAFKRLQADATAGGWLDVFSSVVSSALIMELEVDTVAQAGLRDAANLLEGVVVARGSGPAAMNALARFFQTEGMRSGSSGPTYWLRVLDEAGVPPGPSSEPAMAGAARAIGEYRLRLGARQDMLEVDLLGGGVPAMEVPDLLGNFQVSLPDPADKSRPETAFLSDLARRWRRFGIVGLPGSGKSTALEQIAAAWANDVDAPLPVLVRLYKAVGVLRDRQGLRLEDWCNLADMVTSDLAPVLADRIRRGEGALFLDGLDECRDQQGRAAAAIRALAEEVTVDTTIVFSVREVGSNVAQSTLLPLTTLEEPQDLKSVVVDLVRHVAEKDPGVVDDVATRMDWVELSQTLHPDVWEVPLLAVLLAVHAARAPTPDLPTTRAGALVAAIKDSVRRWERDKEHNPPSWDPDLDPEMLLDAFGLLGRELMTGQTRVDDCRDVITGALARTWGGGAAARSAALADHALVWWIERVGAFVAEAGVLRPRLRMFAEVGDAMWVAQAPAEARREWLGQVMQDPGKYREAALLASTLNGEIANELVASADRPATVLMAADAVAEGIVSSTPAIVQLVRRLGDFFRNPPSEPQPDETDDVAALAARLADRRTASDGPGWEFGYRLTRLPLPQPLPPLRDSFLEDADGTERRAVAAALAAAADCALDERDPDERERQALRSVLELPVPPKEEPRQRRSRLDPIEISSGPPILTGRAEAVTTAIGLVGLTEETANAASELVDRAWSGESERLRVAIRRAGFTDALRRASDPRSVWPTYEKLVGPDPELHTRFVLSVGAELARHPATWWEPWREWRLDAAAALFEVLAKGRRPLGASQAAVRRDPELVRRLVAMAARATSFPLAVVAVECRRALELLNQDALGTSVLLHERADPNRPWAPRLPVVLDEDLADLAECLRSRNPVLFWPAALWLEGARRRDLLKLFWDTLGDMWGEHRRIVAEWLSEVSGRHLPRVDRRE